MTNLDACSALFYNNNGQDAAEEPISIPWYNHREEVAAWGIRPVIGGKAYEESEFTIGGTRYVYPRNGAVTPTIADYSEEP